MIQLTETEYKALLTCREALNFFCTNVIQNEQVLTVLASDEMERRTGAGKIGALLMHSYEAHRRTKFEINGCDDEEPTT